jgi:hypothetical protein
MIVPARDVFWCHAGDDRFTHTTPLARELNCGTIGCRVGEGETLEGRSPTDAINDGLRASTCAGGHRDPPAARLASTQAQCRPGTGEFAMAPAEFSKAWTVVVDTDSIDTGDPTQARAALLVGALTAVGLQSTP